MLGANLWHDKNLSSISAAVHRCWFITKERPEYWNVKITYALCSRTPGSLATDARYS